MEKQIKFISNALCALLLCAGSFTFAGCADDPLGGGDNQKPSGPVVPISIEVDELTSTTVKFNMALDAKGMAEYQEAGLIFSAIDDLDMASEGVTTFQLNRESYSKVFTGLKYNTTYYYTYYLKQNGLYIYGQTLTFHTSDVVVELTLDEALLTATSARINGAVIGLADTDKSLIEVGMFYSSKDGEVENGQGTKLVASEISSDNAVSFDLSKLTFGTTYYYCSYVKQGDSYVYGEVKTFVAGSVTLSLSAGSITATTAQISGTVTGLADTDKSQIEVGMFYSSEEGKVENGQGIKLTASEISSDNAVSFDLSELTFGTTYYYCSYVKQGDRYVYGEVKTFTKQLVVPSGYTNLSAAATANCYIVSQSGSYCLLVAKGNQPSNLLGLTEYASVLWESFGTSTTPSVGDLIKSVSYKDGYIAFQTADDFKDGNAVIAAKDANGNILWSWHIWFTDQPQGQEYYNNAGTMMDRNLGATSATPGDVGALGLLYQWGRKDPFLGSSSINESVEAKSTITWPSAVSTSSSRGTVDYVTSNPTVFVYASSSPYDWHYSSCDNTLWTNSSSTKSIYDPCPAGWRVPDGGSNGVWSKALGSSSSFTQSSLYNSTNESMNFSGKFGSASTIWYPASGCRDDSGGSLNYVDDFGTYWSASPGDSSAYSLYFTHNGFVYPSDDYNRAYGHSVRCLQVID